MGLKRFVWRNVLGGWSADNVKNIVEEGGIIKGIKRTIKEDFCEDNPITSQLYKIGKADGKVEGYEEASNEYEQKLLAQADLFIQQMKVCKEEMKAYEELLDAYEEEIERLTSKLNKTEAENRFLQALLIRERKLQKLA